ncbi:MAG: cyclopropane-fatty-acyl-phospholipid synthase family protein [Pseudomonadota bacterium]
MLARFIVSYFKEGRLLVRLPNERTIAIGGATEADAPLILRLRDWPTLFRIALKPTLYTGEAYMDGGLIVERGTLYDFLLLATTNLRQYKPLELPFAAWRRRRTQKNVRRAAKAHVAHHYDLSGALFRLFLDADRQYSCAYFREPGMSLEQAQAAKKAHIEAKLLLQPGQRVLDIGSGWGGLALDMADRCGVDVLGVTLSEEQLAEVRARAARAGMADKVVFDLCDYRDVQGLFDRIVSVGMFEHVGLANYQAFFDCAARLLKPDGVMLLHTIGNSAGVSGTNAWTDKYVFPGGCVPALSDVVQAAERAGLIIADIEILRLHYAETLRIWRERFAARCAEAKALYDERFCRMWEYYLAGSEAAFRTGSYVVFQIQLAKRNSAVPITRDYIAEAERATAQAALAAVAAE